MKPDANMISGAMAAEAALARKAAQELEDDVDSLPEDHPLKLEAAYQKKLVGDLAGLPPGHPLLTAMEEARLRFEANQDVDGDAPDDAEQQQKIRRAKKLDAKKAATEDRRREDEQEVRLRAATKRINSSMTETVDALRRLNDNIAASMEDFAGDRYALMKLERLSRVVAATMRGVGESKLSAGRVVANG